MLSVIVPNYNHEPYLRARLQSIFNQSYSDMEVIVLDDSSTDRSLSVIRDTINEYTGEISKIRIVENDTNSGSPFRQWAKGISLAQGQYIWIAESDDVATDAFLATLMPYIESNGLDFCFSQSYIINEHGDRGGLVSEGSWYATDHIFTYPDVQDMIGAYNMVPNASAVIFSRKGCLEYLDHIKGFRYGGDWLFWSLVIKNAAKCGYISTPLNAYRVHSTSTSVISRKEAKHFAEAFRILRKMKMLGLYTNEDFWVNRWLAYNGYNIKSILKNNFCETVKELYRMDQKKLWESAKTLLSACIDHCVKRSTT